MKVTLCSDSQGRFVANKLVNLSNGRVNAFGYVRPNTIFTQVVDSTSLSRDSSPVIILGGSNDSLNNNFKDIFENLEDRLTKLSKSRPVFLCSIPLRYDKATNSIENQELRLVNNYIMELTARMNNVFLIPLHSLERYHFTSHGLHLNNLGKTELAYTILRSLSLWNIENNVLRSPAVEQSNDILQKSMGHTANLSILENLSIDYENIKIIEENMDAVINKFKHDKTTAFLHCISNCRQMSAGVAVSFRKNFGRPKLSDLLNDYLSYQESKEGTAVYGLITKNKYYDKSTVEDYNKAFDLTTEDFKLKKFKHLICSPMGCVRNQIPVKIFAKNIVLFQRSTGASVGIVTHDEKSARILLNGFSYTTFVKLLEEEITNSIKEETTAIHWLNSHLPLTSASGLSALDNCHRNPVLK
uniref:Uncharacterized protein n=1 Tax=Graphocephala atropunctata TaxID=36148 RepID=A0A1B6MP35_9HEMI